MDPRLVGEIGVTLASLGAALQWLRANKGFKDWAYYGVAVALTLGAAYLADPGLLQHWRLWLTDYWTVVSTWFGALVGGTALVSNAAKAAVAKGMDEKSLAIPLTNSKG